MLSFMSNKINATRCPFVRQHFTYIGIIRGSFFKNCIALSKKTRKRGAGLWRFLFVFRIFVEICVAMSTGKLYLFPSLLAPVPASEVLPQLNIELVAGIRYFVVEELRTARRFLKACDRSIDIDSLHFDVLNEHTDVASVPAMLAPALQGHDMGLISEAGCPAVADPGADLVAVAHKHGVEVVPLVGPSSILMSLMASGFNGQSFAFLGYLPFDGAKRSASLRDMEKAIRRGQTQIFIETPYRNRRLIEELSSVLPGDMLLCVACDITGPTRSIRTMPLSKWRSDTTDYSRRPAVFLLYHG